jgi:mRNA interferase RelE/StbE
MTYNVLILRSAQKELSGLPTAVYERVKAAIQKLADNPKPHGNLKLSGREAWRIRVGEYRVVYEMDNKKSSVTILHIGHRRDVYR